ncbi:MAG: SurA N-terminal domain-containing protein, partial [Methylococcaceae bacterium]
MSTFKFFNTKLLISIMLITLFSSTFVSAEDFDTIVAIVEDDVVLSSELQNETAAILQKLKSNKVALPPESVLKRQVLERIIVDKLQRHLAKTSGITVTNENLQSAVADIAQRNNMNTDDFKKQLLSQKMNYEDF